MLTLFKKYFTYLIAGEAVILALAAALIHDHVSWGWVVAAVLFPSLILLAALEMKAGITHQRLLGILYILQRPEDFIKAYEPVAMQEKVRSNVKFTALAYLSNAYAAMGSFKKALSILDGMPPLPESRRLDGDILLAGNRCSIYLGLGDLENAAAQYGRLTALAAEGGGRKSGGTAELLRIRLAAAKGEAAASDADYVREELKKNASALHKTELRYILGLIYTQLGEKDFAAAYLNEAAAAGSQLWAGVQAKLLLKK